MPLLRLLKQSEKSDSLKLKKTGSLRDSKDVERAFKEDIIFCLPP